MEKDLASDKKQAEFSQIYQEIAYKTFLEVNSLARIRQQFVERGVDAAKLDAAEIAAQVQIDYINAALPAPGERLSGDERRERAYEHGKASKPEDKNPWDHKTSESKEWRSGYGYARGLESASDDENPFDAKAYPRERKGWTQGHAAAHTNSSHEDSTIRSAQ